MTSAGDHGTTRHETLTVHRRLRARWSAPAPDVTVEFLSADRRPGGHEVSICRVAGTPDLR